MGNSWFQFKQFHLTQEKSALKAGTDGVLLGAWCRVNNTMSILDVGTGTGLIALMVAQRSEAQVHAVEINESSSSDAIQNFEKSPWTDRLKLFTSDFNDFSNEHLGQYDLVVCNPPFFNNSLRSANAASSMAKHDVTLTFLQLIRGAKKVLKDRGRLAVIIPTAAFDDFRETARLEGFYLGRKTAVIPKTNRPAKRMLLEFSTTACYPESDELVILIGGNQYSEDYVALTRDFYLDAR
jgi:tRNA1Val (adenine37-N6)-methyltransferase